MKKSMRRILRLGFCLIIGIEIILGMLPTYVSLTIAEELNVYEGQSIQAAIIAANDGDVVIVHSGTYYENINFLDKDITLRSVDPNDPNVVNGTIIDGGQAESTVIFRNGEGSTSILNGFVVRNGMANSGGGIYCFSSSPTIINCTIIDNFAYGENSEGGGISCLFSSPTITNCAIIDNLVYGENGEGGGIFCVFSSPTITGCDIIENFVYWDPNSGGSSRGGGIHCSSSSPTITNCNITENFVGGYYGIGGGISCYDSSPTITNCIIKDNSATGSDSTGGGIYCLSSSSLTIANCTITGNWAIGDIGWGGGIYCSLSSSPIIANCTITKNLAGDYIGDGGGIFCSSSSSPTITRCIISENETAGLFTSGGGIACYLYSSPIITNSIIRNNSATDGIGSGGGIHCSSSSPVITNCTITKNSASLGGNGVYCEDSSPYIVNSIFWNNSSVLGGNGSEIYGDNMSNPRLSYCDIKDGYQGLGNINADPLFVDPENDDYLLGDGSPCIDAGHPRMYDNDDSRSDIGAYGGGGGSDPNSIIIMVSSDGSSDFTAIQDAIDYAAAGDVINISKGLYAENIVIGGKDISLVNQGDGGLTIIDGSGSGPVISLSNVGSDALLSGFTIQNGSALSGGGICCLASSPTITDCTITGNLSTGEYDGGGGIGFYSSSPTIINCNIAGNWVTGEYGSGGGIGSYFSSNPTLINCTITENSVTGDYGDGGGIYSEDSLPTIINCTITENSTEWGYSGGIYCEDSSPAITNSILWHNFPQEIFLDDSTLTITYSDIQGGHIGTGNIDADPLFIITYDPNDPEKGKFHLQPGSPCIDTGDPNSNISEDKDGVPRPQDGDGDGTVISDMGAYEYIRIINFEMDLTAGWSMISLPVKSDEAFVTSLLHNAVVIYGYEKGAGYKQVTRVKDMEPGKGYWILLNEPQGYTLTGQPIDEYILTVNEDGWDMFGGCSSPAQASADNCHIGVIYGYVQGSGYRRILESENLKPGKGYWILLNNVTDQAELLVRP